MANSEPNVSDIRVQANVPGAAKFLGWAIHDHYRDEFLGAYQVQNGMCHLGWASGPSGAKKFRRYKTALDVALELELDGDRGLVLLFDVGTQIMVVTKQPSDPEGAAHSPVRVI